SDVAAGALLGAGWGAATNFCADGVWRLIGRAWVSIWWERMPSLARPEVGAEGGSKPPSPSPQPSPPGEGEAATGRANRAAEPASSAATDAPSPRGEGWGEGERRVGTPGLAHAAADPADTAVRAPMEEKQWLRLGYILTGALLLFRIFYLAL